MSSNSQEFLIRMVIIINFVLLANVIVPIRKGDTFEFGFRVAEFLTLMNVWNGKELLNDGLVQAETHSTTH